MRIALLTTGEGWHVQDLQRAGTQLGMSTTLVDPRTICSTQDFTRADALLVRSLPPGTLEQIVFRMDLLADVQARGLPVINPPRALETCVDKYLTTSLLARAGLPVPRTVVCQDAVSALLAFEELGGDVVVKPLFGSEGRGLMRVSDAELAWRVFHSLERVGSVLYVQEFVRHPGWDVRAFVLNGEIVAAMKRSSHDWRTNASRGAMCEPLQLSASLQALAIRAAKETQSIVAGVDLLQGDHGTWYILEVNAIPGWRHLTQSTGVDVAKAIMEAVGEIRRTQF